MVDVKPWAALFNDNLWHELVHMYLAGYIVAGFLVAAVYAFGWLRGQARAPHRIGLVVALTFARSPRRPSCSWATGRRARSPSASRSSSPRSRGCQRREGRRSHRGSTRTARSSTGSRSRSCCRCSPTTTPTRPSRARQRAGRRPAPDQHRAALVPGDGLHRHRAGRARRLVPVVGWRRGRLPRSLWFYRALVAAGPLAVVALISGWITTEVGRQPWIVYEVMRTEEAVTGAGGILVGYATLVVVYLSLAAIAGVMLLRRLAAGRWRPDGCCPTSQPSSRWHRPDRLRGARRGRLRRRLLGPDRRRRPGRRCAR